VLDFVEIQGEIISPMFNLSSFIRKKSVGNGPAGFNRRKKSELYQKIKTDSA